MGRMWDKLQHEMYWNIQRTAKRNREPRDKLQHEMYWNRLNCQKQNSQEMDKLQHEMYWNAVQYLINNDLV